jgi:predicted nucleotidyltransferase
LKSNPQTPTLPLERVISDAMAEGYAAAEGYPKLNETSNAENFTGPIQLYEKQGFAEAERLDGWAVMSEEGIDIAMESTDKQVFEIILSLAEKEEYIRAVLLEGSRANPNTVPDRWQDFDIAYVTAANAPYIDGTWVEHKLLPHFGEIAIKQIPDNGDPNDVYTWLIQFTSGLRIDLTFNSLEFLSRPHVKLESATVVPLDKDSRFSDVPPANEADYLPNVNPHKKL